MTNEIREKVERLSNWCAMAGMGSRSASAKSRLDEVSGTLRDLIAEIEALKAEQEQTFQAMKELRAREEAAESSQVAVDGYRCTGCGHLCEDPKHDLEILQKAGAIACCPERKMVPLRSEVDVKSRAISEFCENSGILPSHEALGLPEDVKRFRANAALKRETGE